MSFPRQPVAAMQFEYGFDMIVNRTASRAGGNAAGQDLRTSKYGANEKNQITTRTNPAYASLMGEATNTATVTVNDERAARHGDYYYKELSANNNSGPVWLSTTTKATQIRSGQSDLVATTTGGVFIPKNTQDYTYDADGNLLSDGRFDYTWNALNQLKSATTIQTAADAGAPKQQMLFEYDWRGRRIAKTVNNWVSGAWSFGYKRKFLYWDWMLVAETDQNNVVVRAYSWSGNQLFSINDNTYGMLYAVYDGNRNVLGLIKPDGTIVAQYEYGPFGELMRSTGDMAFRNPIRFSSEYHDDETGLIYFGYRYYASHNGKWINQDPIGELGGLNLYRFIGNNPISRYDLLGLFDVPILDQGAADWNARVNMCKSVVNGSVTTWFGVFGATALNSILDIENGMMQFVAAIPKIGENTYKFVENPTLENSQYLLQDINTSIGVALLVAPVSCALKAESKLPCNNTPKVTLKEPVVECVVEGNGISQYGRVKLSKGLRAEIWERSKAPDGKVYDPTGVEIKPGEPWQAGHRPNHKFSDAQKKAAQECWDQETWKKYQRDPDIYRPEKPRTNLSHEHESTW